MQFSEGEVVLSYHGKMIYEAKVLKVDPKKKLYLVHYAGWNKKWDEWVEPKRVMEKNDLNLGFAKKIAEAAAPKATTRKAEGERKGKKARIGDEDAEPQMRLTMQFPLKKQLVDDWEHVAQRHDLVKLPRSPSVADVLDEYVESRKRKGRTAENKIVQEVATGIRHYFNRALGRLLLYRFERQQYHDIVSKLDTEGSKGADGGAGAAPPALANVYGPEHLLRLFVKLPALLAHTDLEPNELELLNARLQDFLKFMHKNAARYFRDSYMRAPDEYSAAYAKAT